MRPELGTEDDDHGSPPVRASPRGNAFKRCVYQDRARPPLPIDAACQQLRPLVEYADRLPSGRRGKRLNRATLWRWSLRGLRGGRRLRTVTAGGTRVTCDAWVWEFLSSNAVGRRVPVGSGLDRRERELVAKRLGAAHRQVRRDVAQRRAASADTLSERGGRQTPHS